MRRVNTIVPATQIDIQTFIRKYVEDIPSGDYNALVNQIAFLDQYKSIQLRKGTRHYLNDIITKMIWYYHPEVLYRREFVFHNRTFSIELVDFGDQCVYRAQMLYNDMQQKVSIRFYHSRSEGETYLVEKLSHNLILEKIIGGEQNL